ncbi:MAG TPA: hypothetical protein VKS01_10905 [Bryobacteraceae bacterium]|nr:hypothetical protein [Bryobacteraceae bacterium]
MTRSVPFTIVLMAAGLCHATTLFSDAGSGALRTGDGFSLGVEFTVNDSQPLFVFGLGIWDPSGNALASDHEIGLWDVTAGNIMVDDATVTAGTTNGGTPGFLFVSVPQTLLNNGDTYQLATYYTNSPNTDTLFNCCSGSAPTNDPNFTGLVGVFTASNTVGSLSEPNGTAGHAYVGPNMQFGPAPEPGTGTLLLSVAVLGGCIRAMRRRR